MPFRVRVYRRANEASLNMTTDFPADGRTGIARSASVASIADPPGSGEGGRRLRSSEGSIAAACSLNSRVTVHLRPFLSPKLGQMSAPQSDGKMVVDNLKLECYSIGVSCPIVKRR